MRINYLLSPACSLTALKREEGEEGKKGEEGVEEGKGKEEEREDEMGS
jgi:hypothetical protein